VQAECFPTTFQSFSFGIGACIAHLSAMASSILSEMQAPIPMVVFEILCVIAFIASFRLIIPGDKEALLRELLQRKTNSLAALPAHKKTIMIARAKTILQKYQYSKVSFKVSNIEPKFENSFVKPYEQERKPLLLNQSNE